MVVVNQNLAPAATSPHFDYAQSVFTGNEAGGTATVSVSIDREIQAGLDAVVQFSTADGTAQAGTDYEAASGVLVFAPGETTKTFDIVLLNDESFGGVDPLTIQLSLSGALGGYVGTTNATATVEIGDDDLDTDSDGDGLSDFDELSGTFGFSTNAASADTDGDGLTDAVEINGTKGFPTNPTVADTDGDTVGDGTETNFGTNPTDPASLP
jgi:hypothetical protein